MSDFTLTNAMISDLEYEMNDEDIWNDILLIEGAAGAEQLTRGYSATSITKYGRRSRRIDRPLAASEETAEALVEDHLDRYSCESSLPKPIVTVTVPALTDAVLIQLFTRTVSDTFTVQNTEMGMNQDFYIEGLELNLGQELVNAVYDLVGV